MHFTSVTFSSGIDRIWGAILCNLNGSKQLNCNNKAIDYSLKQYVC